MQRAVIVAVGNLSSLPAELQDVANILSADGWTVRLCLDADASRAGLARAAAEGPADLAWMICHASAAGFVLSDGVLSPDALGAWLALAGAHECVLNACHSVEHVTAIQRVASVGVACTIDPAGVSDALALAVGVSIVRSYVESNDMAAAVAEATGNGIVQYRYVPRGGRGSNRGGGRMSQDDQELLRQLVSAIKGDGYTGIGLIKQWQNLSDSLANYVEEQEKWRADQQRVNHAHEERLRVLEVQKPFAVTERSVYVAAAAVLIGAVLLLLAALAINGGLS